jgi:hypothetical protein
LLLIDSKETVPVSMTMLSPLVTVLGLVNPIPAGPLSLGYELKFVDTKVHPHAVCNDGTPAAYYIYRSDPTQWVLHQQGGWWCWDDYSCQVRWDHFANHSSELRTLMSTAALADLTKQHDTFNGEKNTGIMAHNRSFNPVAGATKVFLVYCSSDAHAGNTSVQSSLTPGRQWHFRGKEILRAVMAELVAKEGLSAAATYFVLTGGSAGGMATLNNADWVGQLVRQAAPHAKFVAMPGAVCARTGAPHAGQCSRHTRVLSLQADPPSTPPPARVV